VDHAIFDSFAPYCGPTRDNFHRDYAGAEFACSWTLRPVAEPSLDNWTAPIPSHNEEYFEWVDLLESIQAAGASYTMVELGAGFGRWGVRAGLLAKRHGIKDIRLIFVEGEPKHVHWLRESIDLNSLTGTATVHEAAIAYGGEPIPFLVSHDTIKMGFGQCAGWEGRGEPTNQTYYGRPTYRTPSGYSQIFVGTITLEHVTRDLEFIDLIDMDLQKAERDVIQHSMETLNAKVRRVHIGTHAPDIEEELRAAFSASGWRNVWDFSCLGDRDTPYGRINFVDGVQGWINPRLA
jgi:FkbM family methyltransferase